MLRQGIFGAWLLHNGMPTLGSFLMAFSFYLAGWVRRTALANPRRRSLPKPSTPVFVLREL